MGSSRPNDAVRASGARPCVQPTDIAEGPHAQRWRQGSDRHPASGRDERAARGSGGNGRALPPAGRGLPRNRRHACGVPGHSARGLRACAVRCSGRHAFGSGRSSWPAGGRGSRTGCGRRSGAPPGSRRAGHRSGDGRACRAARLHLDETVETERRSPCPAANGAAAGVTIGCLGSAGRLHVCSHIVLLFAAPVVKKVPDHCLCRTPLLRALSPWA